MRANLVNMNNYFQKSEEVRPIWNLGYPFDCMSGEYTQGKHGESISLGGLWPTVGIGGPGNTNKSTLSHHFVLTVMARYMAQALNYDTEASASRNRWYGLAQRFPELCGVDLIEENQLMLTDSTMMYGNEFFEMYKKMSDDKIVAKKDLLLTTPIVDSKGKQITIAAPTAVEIDSLSMFGVKSVEEMADKSELGDSGRNTMAMRSAGVKAQMLQEIPVIVNRASMPTIFTAHIGKEIKIDPYAPSAKNLTYLKNGMKFKHIPENFTFVVNTCWYIFAVDILKHKDGGPEYPSDSKDKFKGDTDLQEIFVTTLRNKGMISGIPFSVVISQREGVLPELTALVALKAGGRFGLCSDTKKLDLDLYPEVSLDRVTVRSKIDTDHRLRRAFEITGEMQQIFNFHDKLNAKYRCTPKQLRKELEEKGYDWQRLLNTRGYWIPDEHTSEYEFLSTMDLLKMRVGEYHPWWYGDLNKKTESEPTLKV